jgi:hypothetical protein
VYGQTGGSTLGVLLGGKMRESVERGVEGRMEVSEECEGCGE